LNLAELKAIFAGAIVDIRIKYLIYAMPCLLSSVYLLRDELHIFFAILLFVWGNDISQAWQKK
jgi:hypothetical protein